MTSQMSDKILRKHSNQCRMSAFTSLGLYFWENTCLIGVLGCLTVYKTSQDMIHTKGKREVMVGSWFSGSRRTESEAETPETLAFLPSHFPLLLQCHSQL